MRNNVESGGFGFPDRRQVAKVPALDIFSFWRVGLGGGYCKLPAAKLCDQSRHIPALPQQFAPGIHHTNIHAVKIFKLGRLPVRGTHLHAALPL
ncbi:MAG: Uncharacterised protein [Halieaceae bacterium]|nr:MAG: Uncharacterised protein [Halieaceae bacterium]